MAAQRVQHYLEVHKIGPLFENLMAALIKDMPNEPMPYLIRTLQKADQKLRSPRGVTSPRGISASKGKSASTSRLNKTGFGVTGVPAPKSNDRPAVFKSMDPSDTAHFRKLQEKERPSSADHHKRGYQKPWLTGAKSGSKMEPRKAERPATSGKIKQEWNKDTKTNAKDFDELFESQQAANVKPLTQQNADRSKMVKYEGAKTWASGEENAPPDSVTLQGNQKAKIDRNFKDEIEISDIKKRVSVESADTDSMKSGVRSKKLKPGSQAAEKKLKLKALLNEEKDSSKSVVGHNHDDDDDSGDDTVEVLEQADDLQGEGVKNAVSTGNKLSKNYRSRGDESKVQIKICARCAKVITTGPCQLGGGFSDTDSEPQPMRRPAFSDITASDDDFESVSQIGAGGVRQQRWPVLDEEDGSTSRQEKRMYPSAPTDGSPPITGRDFFKDNAPARIRPPQQKQRPYFSDTESEGPGFPAALRDSALQRGQAWAVRPAETGSEAESELGR